MYLTFHFYNSYSPPFPYTVSLFSHQYIWPSFPKPHFFSRSPLSNNIAAPFFSLSPFFELLYRVYIPYVLTTRLSLSLHLFSSYSHVYPPFIPASPSSNDPLFLLGALSSLFKSTWPHPPLLHSLFSRFFLATTPMLLTYLVSGSFIPSLTFPLLPNLGIFLLRRSLPLGVGNNHTGEGGHICGSSSRKLIRLFLPTVRVPSCASQFGPLSRPRSLMSVPMRISSLFSPFIQACLLTYRRCPDL